MTIHTLARRVEAVNVDKITTDSLNETESDRVELNREQMQSGIRSDGSDILPSYSPTTVFLKRLIGQETRWVTLYSEGDFQARIKSDVTGDSIITESTDWKNEKLKRKYETSRGKLFGLSHDFKVEYISKSLRPVFNGKITNVTGLKFR